MSDATPTGVDLPPTADGGGPAPGDGRETTAPDRATAPASATDPESAESAEPSGNPVSPVAPVAPVAPVSGDYRMALVSSVTVDLPSQHPTVVLRESESPRRQLSFSIAFPDAVVLSHALRRIQTPRPLTHELMTGILQSFDIDVVAVRLVGRAGAVYFAELDLRGRTGRSVHSCRPSDALTIALQQPVPVPILIDRRLFEQVGDVTPPGSGPSS